MTFLQHTLVAFGGRLGSTSNYDAWQCGVRMIEGASGRTATSDDAGATGNVMSDPAGYLSAITTPLKNWFQTTDSVTSGSEFMAIRNDAYLDWVKVNNIATTGRYLTPSTPHTFFYTAAGVGAKAVISLPTIITTSVRLTTARLRGPSHAGRIYLPLAPTLGSWDNLSSTQQTQAMKTVKALLAVLETPTGTGGTAIRATIQSKSGTGHWSVVNGLACGNVIDVQRRRKEQLPETFATLTYP